MPNASAYERYVVQGTCTSCKKVPAADGRTKCADCAARMKRYTTERRERLKMEREKAAREARNAANRAKRKAKSRKAGKRSRAR